MSKLDRREFLASIPLVGVAASLQRTATSSVGETTSTKTFFQMPIDGTISGAYVDAENAGSDITLRLLEASGQVAGIPFPVPTDWICLCSVTIENTPYQVHGQTHAMFNSPYKLRRGSYYCLETIFEGAPEKAGLIIRDFPGHDKVENPHYPFGVMYGLLPIGNS